MNDVMWESSRGLSKQRIRPPAPAARTAHRGFRGSYFTSPDLVVCRTFASGETVVDICTRVLYLKK